jgi:hypothetical protein
MVETSSISLSGRSGRLGGKGEDAGIDEAIGANRNHDLNYRLEEVTTSLAVCRSYRVDLQEALPSDPRLRRASPRSP